MTIAIPAKAGLEDIVAASSAICYLDGERGVLAYRGYDIHDLADQATFEEVCYLLWHGRLPNRAELGELQSQLAASRRLPEGVLRLMRSLPPQRRWIRCARSCRRCRTLIRVRTTCRLKGAIAPACADCAGGVCRGDVGAAGRRRRRHRARSGAEPCGQFPLHAHGKAAEPARGARRSTWRWCFTPTTSSTRPRSPGGWLRRR